MKKLTAVISFLVFTSFCYGQKIMEIGVRINSISINNQTNEFDNFSSPNNIIQRNVESFSIDLFDNIILKNKIRPRIWGGYYKGKAFIAQTLNFSNGETEKYSGFQQISGPRFGVGIGKAITLDSLKIKFGPEVLFFYYVAEKTSFKIEDFDTAGKKYKVTDIDIKQPPYYSIGIGVFANVYYPIWKGFSVGLELSSYFLYGWSKGDILTEYQYFDGNGTNTGTDTETDKIDYSGLNTSYLNISLGLSYQF